MENALDSKSSGFGLASSSLATATKYVGNEREYHREYSRKRRAALLALLGEECAKCGSREDLQFDHVDPSEKSFNISSNMTASNQIVRQELAKCQLLCGDCHRAKSAVEAAGFTHGTLYGWMKKKCGCSTCFASKRRWHEARNERRRWHG